MQGTFSKFVIIGGAFAAIVGITVLITGQPASKLSQQPDSSPRVGVPDDWSHHHLVFSNPGTYEQAVKTGASYAKWHTIRYDSRFILQQMKRHAESAEELSREMRTGGAETVSPSGMAEPEDLAIGILRQLPGEARTKPKPTPKPKRATMKRDWSEPMLTGTVQPNAYPATWVASPTSASCSSDFVVYPTGAAGTSIVAYNNLYSGCSGDGADVPSVYWAYNTYGATISTSPIISVDGSQVAFIESYGTLAALVLVKWASAGTLASPVIPIVEANDSYRDYTVLPCMTFLGHYGPTFMSDTFSAPFYDDANDALYVGDDGGYLHKFTGIFYGNPAEAASPWPVQVSTTALASPVYDSVSGNVFVGDTGGYLYAVSSASGSVTTSAQLGDTIIDGPLVDSSAGMVYAFVTTSGGNNTVYQFPTNFTGGTGNGSVAVGAGGTGYYLYSGDFDNVYYQSSDPPTGNLYVVGNTGATTGATLYQIPIIANAMQGATAVITGLTGSSDPPWPSPLTEVCNNGTSACVSDGTSTTSGIDYLFFSVNSGTATGCSAGAGKGCVLSYNISTPSSPAFSAALNVTDAGSPGCWATSGIVIDSSVPSTGPGSLAGASQVYFINLNGNTAGGAGGATSNQCASGTAATIQAVQASQAALQ